MAISDSCTSRDNRLAPGTEAITRLGRHLAALPLPPAAGKLLLYGLLFKCLDPLLTIACGLAYRCAVLHVFPNGRLCM